MAIPIDDYRNQNVGSALVQSITAMQRVQKMVKADAEPADLEHAIRTGELTVEYARATIARADVCNARKQETLEWLNDYESQIRACRPADSTH